MYDSSRQKAINIVLIGKAGNGKTSTAASIVTQELHGVCTDQYSYQGQQYDLYPATITPNNVRSERRKTGGCFQRCISKCFSLCFPCLFEDDINENIVDASEYMSQSLEGSTARVVLFGSAVLTDGTTNVNVFDTPPLFDTTCTDMVNATDATIEYMKKAIDMSGSGVNAFLLVLRYGHRFTEEEVAIVKRLSTLFGSSFFKDHVVVIFTNGDDYRCKSKGAPFSHWLSQQKGELGKLIQTCGNRCVLFENVRCTPETKVQQRNELWEIVSRMDRNYVVGGYHTFDAARVSLLKQAEVEKRRAEFDRRRHVLMEDYNRAKRESGWKREQMLAKVKEDGRRMQAEAHVDDRAEWEREMQEIEKVVKEIIGGKQ